MLPPIFSDKDSIETVIPDGCNTGVVFKTLLAVNGAVLTAILLRTGDFRSGLVEFMESSMLIEPVCLLSLLILCRLRRLVYLMSPWMQRIACAVVPATFTGIVVYFFSLLDWLWSSFTNLTLLKGVGLAALLGMLLQHYFELRMRAFSPVLVEARLQALQARIRPHFLFNSLNAVLSLIRTQPHHAENTLSDLADLFRVLMSDLRTMISLEDEIRLCTQYLSIEKTRLGERLHVHWEIENLNDAMMRKVQVPVLLLQPLLENAVHYGVEPAIDPAPIRIHVSRSVDRIEITVINAYLGDKGGEGNHMALNNIRERLALLYDVESELTTTIARGFFEVRLRFPYSTALIV